MAIEFVDDGQCNWWAGVPTPLPDELALPTPAGPQHNHASPLGHADTQFASAGLLDRGPGPGPRSGSPAWATTSGEVEMPWASAACCNSAPAQATPCRDSAVGPAGDAGAAGVDGARAPASAAHAVASAPSPCAGVGSTHEAGTPRCVHSGSPPRDPAVRSEQQAPVASSPGADPQPPPTVFVGAGEPHWWGCDSPRVLVHPIPQRPNTPVDSAPTAAGDAPATVADGTGILRPSGDAGTPIRAPSALVGARKRLQTFPRQGALDPLRSRLTPGAGPAGQSATAAGGARQTAVVLSPPAAGAPPSHPDGAGPAATSRPEAASAAPADPDSTKWKGARCSAYIVPLLRIAREQAESPGRPLVPPDSFVAAARASPVPVDPVVGWARVVDEVAKVPHAWRSGYMSGYYQELVLGRSGDAGLAIEAAGQRAAERADPPDENARLASGCRPDGTPPPDHATLDPTAASFFPTPAESARRMPPSGHRVSGARPRGRGKRRRLTQDLPQASSSSSELLALSDTSSSSSSSSSSSAESGELGSPAASAAGPSGVRIPAPCDQTTPRPAPRPKAVGKARPHGSADPPLLGAVARPNLGARASTLRGRRATGRPRTPQTDTTSASDVPTLPDSSSDSSTSEDRDGPLASPEPACPANSPTGDCVPPSEPPAVSANPPSPHDTQPPADIRSALSLPTQVSPPTRQPAAAPTPAATPTRAPRRVTSSGRVHSPSRRASADPRQPPAPHPQGQRSPSLPPAPPDPNPAVRPVEPLSLGEIHGVRARVGIRPTLVNIPRKLRGRYASLLLTLLEDACQPRDPQGPPPPLAYVWPLIAAGGTTPASLHRRIGLAERGLYRSLLRDHTGSAAPPAPHSFRPKHLRAARSYMAYGELTKAISRLMPPLSGPPPTRQDIEALFPPTDGVVVATPSWPEARPSHLSRALDTEAGGSGSLASWTEAVVASVRRTGYSSAPGPDGIRASHLRQLLVVKGTGPQIALALGRFTDSLVCGRAHPFVDGVALSMIRKPGGGFRPIGVGSILRRAPLRVVAERLRRDVGPFLVSHGQLGLVEAGPQRAYLRAQKVLDAHCATLRLDVSNAFNAVTRAALMAAAQRVGDSLMRLGTPSPALAAACLAYERPTCVYVNGSSDAFQTSRGVTQGCPLGSILFDICLADLLSNLPTAVRLDSASQGQGLSPIVQPMASTADSVSFDPSVVHFIALHDDITLASHSPSLLPAVLRPLKALLSDAGLSLARGKSKVLSHRPVPDAIVAELDASPADAALFAGAPLHTERGREEAEALVGDKARAVLDLMARVTSLGDPQDVVKVTSLAGCWSRMQYLHSLTRGFRIWGDILTTADTLTQALLGHALGAHARHTSTLSWAVALLPVSEGGLGIRSCLIEASLNSDQLFSALEMPNSSPEVVLPVRQRTERKRGRIFNDLAGGLRLACASHPDAIVRLKHQGLKSSARPWLVNASDRDCTLMPPKVAAKALHHSLLGAPLTPGVTLPCGEAIHRATLPAIGDDSLEHTVHLENCSLNNHKKHASVVGAIKKLADETCEGAVRAEQALDPWGNPRDAEKGELRPGDLTVFDGTHHLFLDFTASLPVEGVLREAGPSGKFAICDGAFRAKHAKYAASFARVGSAAKLLPFALSGYGGSYYLSNVALSTFAKAVEAKATAPTPLGTVTLARRMLDAATVQVRAAAARHALYIEDQYGSGPASEHDPAILRGRPYPPFQASCPKADALKATLDAAIQAGPSSRAAAPKAARAALLVRALYIDGEALDLWSDDDSEPGSDTESDGDSDGGTHHDVPITTSDAPEGPLHHDPACRPPRRWRWRRRRRARPPERSRPPSRCDISQPNDEGPQACPPPNPPPTRSPPRGIATERTRYAHEMGAIGAGAPQSTLGTTLTATRSPGGPPHHLPSAISPTFGVSDQWSSPSSLPGALPTAECRTSLLSLQNPLRSNGDSQTRRGGVDDGGNDTPNLAGLSANNSSGTAPTAATCPGSQSVGRDPRDLGQGGTELG